MTPEQLTELEEALEDHEALLLEPRHFFDPFILGFAERGNEVFVVYDKKAMIAEMVRTDAYEAEEDEDYDSETSILEHYSFNMIGTLGRGIPAFLELVDTPEALPTPQDALNAAYRERNAVVAALIRSNGWKAHVAMADDAPGWVIVYAETPEGQVSWHVGPDDFDLFKGLPAGLPTWDGHTTDEKYQRLARLSHAD